MGVDDERTRSCCVCAVKGPLAFFSFLVIALLLVFGVSTAGLALQKPTLGPAETAPSEQAYQGEQPAAQEKAPVHEKERPRAESLSPAREAGLPKAQPHAPEAAAPGAQEHGEDHGQLPEISSIPGVTFVDTLIELMDHELHGRILGWRPNGILICRLTDNVNNYQLGVLEAVRFHHASTQRQSYEAGRGRYIRSGPGAGAQ